MIQCGPFSVDTDIITSCNVYEKICVKTSFYGIEFSFRVVVSTTAGYLRCRKHFPGLGQRVPVRPEENVSKTALFDEELSLKLHMDVYIVGKIPQKKKHFVFRIPQVCTTYYTEHRIANHR